METKKQESIRLAYGEYYDLVKDKLDENGFTGSYPYEGDGKEVFLKITSIAKKEDWENNQFHYRPKSLSGLENNAGWTSILSEEDLPKESGKYFIVTNGKIQVGAYILNYKKWFADGCYYSDTYQNLCITHYQPIIEPNLPIF